MSGIEKNLQSLNEVIVGSSSPAVAKLLARLKRDGRVVRLAPRLYSTNKTDSPENIVRRNLWTIVGKLWPGARLGYRTAFEYAPHDGHIFLGYKYTRKVALPGLTDEFLEILRSRHRVVMSGRPSCAPGLFKTRDNRAGNTHFVSFDRVRGTLKRGFDMSRSIRHPFARAVFIMFLTSEVHPFADGNGRISRLMMNAELTAAGQTKIIVPTVFRPDYIGALRRLSRDGDPEVLVAAMARLWDFGRWLSCGDFETIKNRLEKSGAFSDDDGVILRFGN